MKNTGSNKSTLNALLVGIFNALGQMIGWTVLIVLRIIASFVQSMAKSLESKLKR